MKFIRASQVLVILVYIIAAANITLSIAYQTGFGGRFGPLGMSAPASICFVLLATAVLLLSKIVEAFLIH